MGNSSTSLLKTVVVWVVAVAVALFALRILAAIIFGAIQTLFALVLVVVVVFAVLWAIRRL
jgi:hypothetical protein